MAKYVYPAYVYHEPDGYIIDFPDWRARFGGMTDGKTWHEAMYMGNDLLGLMCMCTEDDQLEFPTPSTNLIEPPNGAVTLFYADTDYYRTLCARNKKRRLRRRMTIRAMKERSNHHVTLSDV
jgi:predicted RNase H-like HicB family nuclease